MLPYSRYPFQYYGRNASKITPAPVPPIVPEVPVTPAVPPTPAPVLPVEQPPVQPTLPPMQPVMPIQQPVMPIQQPVCPFTGMPVSPAAMPMGPSGMPMGPAAMPMMPSGMPMGPATMPMMPSGMLMGPTAPMGPGLGNFGNFATMGIMGNMGGMGGMDQMDLGPATASPDDPPPVLSDNPPVANVSLFKELTGYPNYGNPSGNADILYTGNRGTWSFDVPVPTFITGANRYQLLISAVLDDHRNVPTNLYSARITFNGTVIHDGPVPLQHGFPEGGRFNNWRTLTFNVRNIRRNNRIVIVNTSRAGVNDWIGLDWMELRLVTR